MEYSERSGSSAAQNLADDARSRRDAELAHRDTHELLDRVRTYAHLSGHLLRRQPVNQVKNRLRFARAEAETSAQFGERHTVARPPLEQQRDERGLRLADARVEEHGSAKVLAAPGQKRRRGGPGHEMIGAQHAADDCANLRASGGR